MRSRSILIVVLVLLPGSTLAGPEENLLAYTRIMNGCRGGLLEDYNLLGSLIATGRTIETVCSCASAALLATKDAAQRQALAKHEFKPEDLLELRRLMSSCVAVAR